MATLTRTKTNWNQTELKAYTLIYCMNADMKEAEQEIKIIIESVGQEIYDKMSKEFENDNDYESIQKIRNTVEDLNYNKVQIQDLFTEMKTVFDSDDEFSILERNVTLGLKRILNY
ncbi:hypothetical protein [Tenacibaculum agarivorans]|uniref:hypothetical protein n=1 Tax=Tenacibaculum agarivorans TaxID=1908389 RepID=UPI00094B895A|nr:hypothetical protein [Tenacibaculum agarivorans]